MDQDPTLLANIKSLRSREFLIVLTAKRRFSMMRLRRERTWRRMRILRLGLRLLLLHKLERII